MEKRARLRRPASTNAGDCSDPDDKTLDCDDLSSFASESPGPAAPSQRFNLDFSDSGLRYEQQGGIALYGKGTVDSPVQSLTPRGPRQLSLNFDLSRNGEPLALPVAQLNLKLPPDAKMALTKKALAGIALGVWSSSLAKESFKTDASQ